jgi:hypothetical protein
VPEIKQKLPLKRKGRQDRKENCDGLAVFAPFAFQSVSWFADVEREKAKRPVVPI